MALVLMAVVPDTERFLEVPEIDTVSVVPLPKTALPVIVNPNAPEIVPLKVVVVAVRVLSREPPSVTLLL